MSSLSRIIAILGGAAVVVAAGPTSAQNVTWRSIGGGEFGAMFGIAISPHDSNVIVGGVDMGNAFMTRDGGKSWRIVGCNVDSATGQHANPGYRGVWSACFDPVRPERVFIGSTHGVYRSTDNGDTWRLVRGGSPAAITSALAVDVADPNVVYAGSGGGVRTPVAWGGGEVAKSLDGGDTWQTITPPLPAGAASPLGRNWVRIAIDPLSPVLTGEGHSRLYLCGQAGFYRSDDAGRSWTSLEAALPGGVVDLKLGGVHTSGIADLALVPDGNRTLVYATIQVRAVPGGQPPWLGGVYVSADGGQTWSARNRGLERVLAAMPRSHSWSAIVSCPAAPGTLYWGASDGIYKTTDGGGQWQLVTRLGTEWKQGPDYDGRTVYWRLRTHDTNYDGSFYNDFGPTNGLACSATDPNAVAYTDNAGCGLSRDGGEHWTEPGFEFGEAVWPGEWGDRPPMVLTHKFRSRGIQLIVPMDVAVDPFDPLTIAIGHHDTGLHISRDGGQWWEWAYHGLLEGDRNNVRSIVYDPAVKGRIFVGAGGWAKPGHVYRSDDGGRHFQLIGIPRLSQGGAHVVAALALDPASPVERRTLYAATDAGLFRTPDGGTTWSGPEAAFGSLAVRHVLVDGEHHGRLYASARSGNGADPSAGLYRSDDSGATWHRLGAGQLGTIVSVSICPGTDTVYALAFAPGAAAGLWAPRTLYHSTDAGATWQALTTPPLACAAVSRRDPARVYATTFSSDVTKQTVNVLRSTDCGRTWLPVGSDIPLSPGGDTNGIIFDAMNPARFFVMHNAGTYEGIEE